MIFDRQTLFSDAQAITATAASTNVVDLGPINTGMVRDIGKGHQVPLRVQVVETFNTLTSLTIALQTDNDVAFGSPKTVYSVVVPLADLKAGYIAIPEDIPRGTDERYMRLNYTVTGTAPTLGRITAGVVWGAQD